MSVYEYHDYKPYLASVMQAFPNHGRGQARRLAEHLSVSSVVISQILSGNRHFTPEQALQVAAYFGFDERSTEYFVLLVNQARAGSKTLVAHYESKLEKLRRETMNLKNRVIDHRELSEADKGVFYSNWFYSGIRLLSSIEGYNSVEAIATYFGLSRAKVAEVVEFLVDRGLCKEENGHLQMGVTATYVDSASRFVNSHRRNWRLKGLERFTEPGPRDLFYSSPFSLSNKDADLIRKEIVKMIGEISKRVGHSDSEKLTCLNIDYFEF
jgi:uncharacterized protein (TIGR02147 family)